MTTELLRSPVLTEKSVRLMEKRQYTFDVDPRLNKLQIKRLVEDLFKVSVEGVNTHLLPPQKRRLAGKRGMRGGSKRAVVTLRRGELIRFFDTN